MRDLAVTVFIFAILPVCVIRPWLGILAWYWFGLMNPHRLTWDFAYSMPFGMLIGGATLIGFLFAKDRRAIPWNLAMALSALLMLYFTATSFFAWAPATAWAQWDKVMKVIFMTFIATKLIYGHDRIRALMLTVVVSLGFYGVKDGINMILAGGTRTIQGVPGSFLDGNTFMGLGYLMVLPLMIIMAREEKRPWVKRALYAAAALTVVSVIFTYSRGAYLGLVVVLPLLFLKAKRKLVAAAVLIPAALIAPAVLPDKVFDRADKISNYGEEVSANSRLCAWKVAFGIAKDYPLRGAGFEFEYSGDSARWLSYADEDCRRFREGAVAAHSIYFQMMGQHGLLAFALYATLLGAVLLSLLRTQQQAASTPALQWAGNYASAVQVALIAYLVSGAFINAAYFDLAWLYFALSAILAREIASARAGSGAGALPAAFPPGGGMRPRAMEGR